jgi:serine/threonine-protein kinase
MMGRLFFRLGNYEPLLELASGGMATVYLARQLGAAGFERLVVIKRVHPHLLGNRDFYDMFRDEARVASLIRHQNVVPVTNVAESDGELFLVMEYVESVSLGTLVKTTNANDELVPPRVLARILCDVLAGLHAAHDGLDMMGAPLHVVHRDVSPQNIIIGTDGSSRIIDFGIAQAADRLSDTKTGSLKGKLAYMAPEQTTGRPTDKRIDIFSAGVTLHEALTGKRLFRGENDIETLKRIVEQPIPDPSSIVPDLPWPLDAVVQRALARNPDERYPTAAAFQEALEAAIAPASPREVAAYLKSKVGDRLAERHQRLRAILDGSMPSLAAQSEAAHLQRSGAPYAGDLRPVGSAPVSAPMMPQSSDSRSNIQPLSSERSGNTGTRGMVQELSLDGSDFQRPPNRGLPAWSLAVGALAVLGVAIAGIWVGVRAGRGAAGPSAAADPSAATNEIELTLAADAPIERVQVSGANRIELASGKARVRLAPWEGPLAIDADLAGGGHAHAEALPSGAREITLTTLASPARSAVAENAPVAKPPTTSTAEVVAANPAPTAPTRVVRRAPAVVVTKKKTELHDNPYK